jgi:HlyD family secretion protein
MKRIVRILWVVALIAAIGGGGYWFYRSRAAAPAAPASGGYTQVVAVRQGNLNSTVSVVGQLEAVQRAELAFDRLTGTARLTSLAVKPGHTVTAGQVLAAVDPAPYQQALDQAKSALQAAEKTLADLLTPPTALQIAQADLAIARAEVQLQQAQTRLAELGSPDLVGLQNAVLDGQDSVALTQLQATLAEHTNIAKTERDLHYNVQWWQRRVAQLQELEREHEANLEQMQERAKGQELLSGLEPDLARIRAQRELTRQAAAAELAKGKAALADALAALAQAGGDAATALAVAQARLAIQEAEVALLSAQEARRTLAAGADPTALATAQAAVAKQRQAVSEAAADLAAATLVAPFAGTVLQTRAGVGDQLTANSVVVSLADLKALQVVAAVDETTIRRIGAGQAAQISFDAFPGQRFRGQVQALPLQGALQGGVMVYDVPVSLVGAEKLALLVGMTANVQVQVAQAADALLVPAMAVQRVGGQAQVLVVNPAAPEQPAIAVPVEVGLSDGVNTQVLSGLTAEDRIVVEVEAAQTTSPSNSSTNQNLLSSVFRQFSRPMGR